MVRNIFVALVALSTLLVLGCKEDNSAPLGSTALTGSDAAASSALAGSNGSGLRAPVENFVAPLSPDQEVPPVDSRATGLAKFQLKGDELSYHLNARADGVTQSHIHCGAAGANGPVVAFLFGFVAGGVDANGRLAAGTITNANVIPRPDSAGCPGGVENLDDVLDKMRTGGAYVNVHTVDHPSGEIRGQIDRGNGTH